MICVLPRVLIQSLDQWVVACIVLEVLVDDLKSRIVNIVVWMLLKVLEVVKQALLLSYNCEFVLAMFVNEFLLSATQSIFQTFQGHCQHSHVLLLQGAAQGSNQASIDEG